MSEFAKFKMMVPLMIIAFIMLISGAVFGSLSAIEYVLPGYFKDLLSFSQLRPMHVSAVLFWILLGATGVVYMAVSELVPGSLSKFWLRLQYLFWMLAIVGVFISYGFSKFGGREYWEFQPVWALPIVISWSIFVWQILNAIRRLMQWPVYVWMWMTGSVFFLWIFIENYFWLFTGLRDKAIADLTVQWKVNGSIVGAWNQLIYGTAFYVMDRIKGQRSVGGSRLAFGMYFLGLFNLMFNWGHHVYTLPGIHYVRYIGYAVSMTEWIFFAKIIYEWKSSVSEMKQYYKMNSYKFIMASNFWVFFNMGMAIVMSIPVFNLYTHGTHITVAHAMGTTIGINTMILLGASYSFADETSYSSNKQHRVFWILQISLMVFVLALIGAGASKGLWQMSDSSLSFSAMMKTLHKYFSVFLVAGIVLMICLFWISWDLIKLYINRIKNQ